METLTLVSPHSFTDSPSTTAVLRLLSQHHLAAFSPQNRNDDLTPLIVSKLIEISAGDSESSETAMIVLKLLALQRPDEINKSSGPAEGAFRLPFNLPLDQSAEPFLPPADSQEPSFVHRLLDVDDPQSLLRDQVKLTTSESASSAWDSYLTVEAKTARKTVDNEIRRLEKMAPVDKQKRRRLRARRTAVADWGLEVKEQDATRTAHVSSFFLPLLSQSFSLCARLQARQDDKEHVAQVQAMATLHATQLRPQPRVGTAGTRLVLDSVEGALFPPLSFSP
jgi:hypothetical protein